MDIIHTSADVITVSLEPDDVLAISNALNEICNGVHLDDWDFQPRMGVEREQVQAVLDVINSAMATMAARRHAEGKER
ncbi:hypothetical protein [Nonomuraea sp. NPDC003804]|uniref:hypothetical protein n=1 Tax=Nonomuraea sp. NPDC003804 TaxID=3154547 RepID=UPI0033B2910B